MQLYRDLNWGTADLCVAFSSEADHARAAASLWSARLASLHDNWCTERQLPRITAVSRWRHTPCSPFHGVLQHQRCQQVPREANLVLCLKKDRREAPLGEAPLARMQQAVFDMSNVSLSKSSVRATDTAIPLHGIFQGDILAVRYKQ